MTEYIQHHSTGLFYKKSARGTQVWEGLVKEDPENRIFLVSRHYVESDNPKPQEAWKEVKGKNIGKANETTALQQAISEVDSKSSKKRDSGYFKEGEEPTDLLRPMLAKSFDEKQIVYPCYIQPKIDGCRALWDGHRLISRKGKYFEGVSHIEAQLQEYDVPLDGEIVLPDGNFQQTVRLIKKERPESVELVYIIYDIADPTLTYDERYQKLEDICLGDEDLPNLCLIHDNTFFVTSFEEVGSIHSQFVSEGYEGSILRDPSGYYELNKRSKSLLKMKDWYDQEFFVVGVERDVRGGVVFVCAKNDERAEVKTFKVSPAMTLEEREQDYSDKIGSLATLKYYDLTNDFTPKCANLIAFRDYE